MVYYIVGTAEHKLSYRAAVFSGGLSWRSLDVKTLLCENSLGIVYSAP